MGTGQRTCSNSAPPSESSRGWTVLSPIQNAATGHLPYPVAVRDTAKSGMGCLMNQCLNYRSEYVHMNVRGSCQNANVSSPRKSGKSVGGSIVVGGWESQPHGEGSQKFDTPLYSVAATGSTTGCEREQDDNAESDLSSGMPNFGEPGAVKVARPVRKGG